MAELEIPISQLDPASSLTGDEILVLVQSGVTVNALLSAIATYLRDDSGQVINLGTITGSSNNYTSTITGASYSEDKIYIFKPNHDSDDVTTLEIEPFGALSIQEFDGTVLVDKTDLKSVNTYLLLNKTTYWLVVGGGSGGGSTNLGYTPSPTNGVVTSDGTDATLTLVDGTNAGLVSPSMKSTWDSKQNALGFTPENVANKDVSNGYAGLTLFKINFKNVLNTFTSFFTNSNTAARTYTFQDRDGIIADDTDLATKQATLTAANFATFVNSTTDKTTPVDADIVPTIEIGRAHV